MVEFCLLACVARSATTGCTVRDRKACRVYLLLRYIPKQALTKDTCVIHGAIDQKRRYCLHVLRNETRYCTIVVLLVPCAELCAVSVWCSRSKPVTCRVTTIPPKTCSCESPSHHFKPTSCPAVLLPPEEVMALAPIESEVDRGGKMCNHCAYSDRRRLSSVIVSVAVG